MRFPVVKALFVLIGALVCSQAGAEILSPLAFPSAKFELPAFGLLESAKQKLPSVLPSVASSRAPAQVPALARRKFISNMPVVGPKSDVDTRMPIKAPDDRVEFKLTVKEPDVELAK